MEGHEIHEMDRISDLPDFILHLILSFLPRKLAAQTCVLSKRWNSIWDSFPIFEFEQCMHIKDPRNSTPAYMEKVAEFINSADKSLQKFSQKKLRMEILSLHLTLFDQKSVSMVERWLLLALENGVKEITLDVHTSLTPSVTNSYTFPQTLFASSSTSAFYGLRELSLRCVRVSDNVIRDIVRHCPNISHFSMVKFHGPKNIEISKLDKLKSVTIMQPLPSGGLDTVIIDAPNLQRFTFATFDRSKFYSIDLNSCHGLKELRLCNFDVTDDLLLLYLSRFPLLECLEVSDSAMLRRVRIHAQRLKILHLQSCDNVESIQIDAPSLSLFSFMTSALPKVLFSENVTCRTVFLYTFDSDSTSFLKLRKFLGDFPQRVHLTIRCIINEASFDIEELGQIVIPPPIKIDHLKLISSGNRGPMDCATLIDGLLWSCHPIEISVPSTSLVQKIYINVLCEKLLDKEHPTCCNSSHFKCWRHDLKAAKIESFGGIEDERLLDLNLLLDTLLSLTKYQEVRFSLEWND